MSRKPNPLPLRSDVSALTLEGRLAVKEYVSLLVTSHVERALVEARRIAPETCRFNRQIVAVDATGAAGLRRICVVSGLPGDGWDGMLCEKTETARDCRAFVPSRSAERMEMDARTAAEAAPDVAILRLLLATGGSGEEPLPPIRWEWPGRLLRWVASMFSSLRRRRHRDLEWP